MRSANGRDWLAEQLRKHNGVSNLETIGTDYILINREKMSYDGGDYSSFIAAVVSEKLVKAQTLQTLIQGEYSFQFIVNIPKDSVWLGTTISLAEMNNLGWGGVGDLMSAIGEEDITNFQKKEYQFVFQGLSQHTRIASLERIFDRLVYIHRHGLKPVQTVLLNEYELTAEHIRHARETYGHFEAILRTNPNGHATTNAHMVASELNATIFQWGEFLGRLNKP